MKMRHQAIVLKEVTGAPAEFCVLPAGRIDMKDYGSAELDEAGAACIIAEYDRRGLDMVIDYEHQTLKDTQAPAAGWIKSLVWKGAEGLWAVVDWTVQAAAYLANREYRYFSPVVSIHEKTGRIIGLLNVALTNMPRIDNLKPLVAKYQGAAEPRHEKERNMIEKLRKLLGLAADAGEDQVMTAVTEIAAKAKTGNIVACREVLEALGAKEGAGRDEVIALVASIKAPQDAAVQLSREVVALKQKIASMEQEDLVAVALKDGKTSPEELDKWGRELALKSPDQFRIIVLSRPAGSVIPVDGIRIAAKAPACDAEQERVAALFGNTAEDIAQYGK